jgi:gluconolactonase
MDRLVTGFQSTGGLVSSRIGYLLFSDVGASKILKWKDGAVTVFREKSNGANGLTFDHQGRLLACEQDRVTRTEKDGSITVLASALRERPIDLIYAIDGNVYFSSAAGVYRGKEIASRECDRAVGVTLSPNQQQLYASDAGQQNIRVFDIAPNGSLNKGRVFVGIKDSSLGGLKTDESGKVWIATSVGIQCFAPSGEHLETIAVPEKPSNLNWGNGFHGLVIAAQTSIYRHAVKASGTRTF